MKTYRVNEVFYSPQGEGVRAGTMNVFVRFSKCNLKCSADDSNGPENNVGFDCDTDFESGRNMTLEEIEQEVLRCSVDGNTAASGDQCKWLVLTGGEPALQVDAEFCTYFHAKGYKLAIETNGTIHLPMQMHPGNLGTFAAEEFDSGKQPDGDRVRERLKMCTFEDVLRCYLIDWICVSPKSAEHTIRQPVAHEVKYVRNADQSLPQPKCRALNYVLSPAGSGMTVDGRPMLDPRAVKNCLRMCKDHPTWRISLQMHRFLGVR